MQAANKDSTQMYVKTLKGDQPVDNIEGKNNPVASPEQSSATPQEIYQKAVNLKEGNGVGKDLPEALALFLQAAQGGFKDAYYDVGIMHYYGQGTKTNRAIAKDCFLNVQHLPRALHMLGMYYQGLAKEEKKSASMLEINSWAGFGDPDVSFAFMRYYSEHYVPPQRNTSASSRAIEYFTKATEKGDAESAHQLGKIRCDAGDHEQAVKWFEKAYELGHKDGNAMFYCGEVYYEGSGVKADFQKAKNFFRQAGDLGHSKAMDYIEKIGRTEIQKNRTILEKLKIQVKEPKLNVIN